MPIPRENHHLQSTHLIILPGTSVPKLFFIPVPFLHFSAHAAKDSGADCIKVQTYTPDTLTIDCSNRYFQVGNGTWQGENLYQLYGKGYMPWEWQPELKEKAEVDRCISFGSAG